MGAELARKHEKVHRLNLELGPKSFQALEKLRASLETASSAETIRIALSTLAHLVEEAHRGGRVVIERKGAEKVEVLIPNATR